jgi:hypothetical protein
MEHIKVVVMIPVTAARMIEHVRKQQNLCPKRPNFVAVFDVVCTDKRQRFRESYCGDWDFPRR